SNHRNQVVKILDSFSRSQVNAHPTPIQAARIQKARVIQCLPRRGQGELSVHSRRSIDFRIPHIAAQFKVTNFSGKLSRESTRVETANRSYPAAPVEQRLVHIAHGMAQRANDSHPSDDDTFSHF